MKGNYYPFSTIEQARRAGFLGNDLFPDDKDEVAIKERRKFIPIEEIADLSSDPESILIAFQEAVENGWIKDEDEFEKTDGLAKKIAAIEKEKTENIMAVHDAVDIFLDDVERKVGALKIAALNLLYDIKEKKRRDKKQNRIFTGESSGKQGKEPWWKNKRRMPIEKKFILAKQSSEFFEKI